MMWYEVLQSDLIPINYMKRGERISIVQKNKIEDPEIYIHYYEASLSECRSLAICESRSLVPLHEEDICRTFAETDENYCYRIAERFGSEILK